MGHGEVLPGGWSCGPHRRFEQSPPRRRPHRASTRGASALAWPDVDIFDIDSLLAQLMLAIGAAMVTGNGFAIVQNARGRAPTRASGEFRAARAWWLLAVGAVITTWGVASLVT